jgi:hypothetical protein
MKAEYFPPREEIILFNEAPSEFYIIVNGSAVSSYTSLQWGFCENLRSCSVIDMCASLS